jgi:hypothetical protein
LIKLRLAVQTPHSERRDTGSPSVVGVEHRKPPTRLPSRNPQLLASPTRATSSRSSVVHEVRSSLEIQIAGIAAERARSRGRPSRRLVPSHGRPLDADELFAVMLDSDRRHPPGDLGERVLDGGHDRVRGHRASADPRPLIEHDPASARAAMREHLERSDRAWKDVE